LSSIYITAICSQFFSPLAKAKDDKPAELLELEDTQNHRSSESSFVNMTAGAAEDVCDSFISKEKKINLC
jgi:negative regulator of sigma E activity